MTTCGKITITDYVLDSINDKGGKRKEMKMFKRTSKVIAIVLTLCMVFTMNSAVFATTANTASDNTFTYVTLGASQTN